MTAVGIVEEVDCCLSRCLATGVSQVSEAGKEDARGGCSERENMHGEDTDAIPKG